MHPYYDILINSSRYVASTRGQASGTMEPHNLALYKHLRDGCNTSANERIMVIPRIIYFSVSLDLALGPGKTHSAQPWRRTGRDVSFPAEYVSGPTQINSFAGRQRVDLLMVAYAIFCPSDVCRSRLTGCATGCHPGTSWGLLGSYIFR